MTERETPTIDGRRRAALRAAAVERARSYTPEWDPDEGDVGTALLDLFAEITEDVLERVDRAPEKHRFAFFDALEFDRDPPQPAKVPLVFDVAQGLDANVAITPGTQALAPPPDEGDGITFEIPDGEGFEATPARLDSVVSVSPADDAIFVHHDALEGESETTLFNGPNRQEHLLYVGHANFFELTPDTAFEVTIEGVGTSAFTSLDYQFFGVKAVDGEETEGWHSLGGVTEGPVETADLSEGAEDGVWIRFRLNEAFAEAFAATTLPTDEFRLVGAEAEAAAAAAEAGETPPVTEVETMWIRFVGPPTLGDALFEASVSKLTLSLVESDDGVEPQMLFANDVPLSTSGEIRPFGEMPLPLDAFYIASDEAFSKTETPVKLGFGAVTENRGTKTVKLPTLGDLEPPDYSWEYWNGSGWTRLELTEQTAELVRFVVPADVAATSVSGHEHHWIRVRVLEENPVQFQKSPNDPNRWEMIHDNVPAVKNLTISYPEPTDDEKAFSSKAKEPDHVVAFNNRSYGADEAKGLSAETEPTTVRPFRRLPESQTPEPRETLYLGFDGPLDDGPIQLLYSAADKPYPVPFYPRARWEFCEDPASETWTQLIAEDGTEGLLQRGIVSLAFPEATAAFERFGRVRHWIRARLVGDPFIVTVTENAAVPGDDRSDQEPELQMVVDRSRNVAILENKGVKTFNLERFSLSVGPDAQRTDIAAPLGPNEAMAVSISRPTGAVELYTPEGESIPVNVRYDDEWTVDTADATVERSAEEKFEAEGAAETPEPVSEPQPAVCGSLSPSILETTTKATRDPPSLRGIYPNAGWAYNVVTVSGEILGGSDGTPGQTFAFANRPVIDESVWVDELDSLSESERTAVSASGVETVERTDDDGAPTAFWVRWTRVEDFVESADDDRHYVLDRIDGRLAFGDGTNGATTPPGEENVSADYRTGGGVAGNVAAEAVEALVTAIPYVEGVWNPDAGGGGAEAETTPDAATRAARTLEDRDRAVTAADFERIAASASRELARVRCLPGVDRSNTPRAGWVTVLLVPRSTERCPTPNAEVKSVVADALRRHAPVPTTTAAGEADASRITVRGPNYVEVGVDVGVAVDEAVASSIAAVETAVTARLTAFFHPLTGGPDGGGWAFGELPCLSDVYAALERVGGVDHVVSLSVTYHGSERGYTVTDDDRLPTVAPDTLVCSSAHTVRATREPAANEESEDRT